MCSFFKPKTVWETKYIFISLYDSWLFQYAASTSELNYVFRVPLCPTCLCALRVCVLSCISTVSSFIFLMYLTRLHFLTCLTCRHFLRALHVLIFLCTFIFFMCIKCPNFFTCLMYLHLFTYLHFECVKFPGSRAIAGLLLSCLREYCLGPRFLSRAYFVGLKFFLVNISWVLNFFPWIFRGFKVFSWALVDPKFFLVGVRGSKLFLVSIRGSEVFSREYFVGPIFFF